MIRGAVFDVDGTLLDSMSIWETLGNDYLLSLGIEPRENLAERFQSYTTREAACYYRAEYGVKLSEEEIIAGINQMIADFYRYRAPAKPGVAEFLQELQSRNVKMCIATATDRHLVESALERCGILPYFGEIFTCNSVGHSKKEPDIYRHACAYLGTAKEETYVFEDAFHAAQTAARDGFPVIAVWDSSEVNQEGLKAMAEGYLQSFTDIEAIRNIF